MEAGKPFLPSITLHIDTILAADECSEDPAVVGELIKVAQRWCRHLAALLLNNAAEHKRVLLSYLSPRSMADMWQCVLRGDVKISDVISFWKKSEYELGQVHQFKHEQVTATLTVLRAYSQRNRGAAVSDP
eukprot:RCo029299